MNLKERWPIILLVVALSFVALVSYQSFFKKTINPSSEMPTSGVGSSYPTKTPEEVKVISEMQTLEIRVTSAGLEPKTLTAKVHDQIRIVNKTGKAIKIEGAEWGKFGLAPERTVVRPFDNPGTFSFAVTGLDASLTGQIIIK